MSLPANNAPSKSSLTVTVKSTESLVTLLAFQLKTADTHLSVFTAHARTRFITANPHTHVKCSPLFHQVTRKVFLDCVVQFTRFVSWNVIDTEALRLQFTGKLCNSQKTFDKESASRDQKEHDLYLKNRCGNCWSQRRSWKKGLWRVRWIANAVKSLACF